MMSSMCKHLAKYCYYEFNSGQFYGDIARYKSIEATYDELPDFQKNDVDATWIEEGHYLYPACGSDCPERKEVE